MKVAYWKSRDYSTVKEVTSLQQLHNIVQEIASRHLEMPGRAVLLELSANDIDGEPCLVLTDWITDDLTTWQPLGERISK